mgnify:CR=1 FL=1
MKALAFLFVMVYFFYDPIFPYAFEMGPWLISQHVLMYSSIMLAVIFYLGSYRLAYYRNIHLTRKLPKLTKEQKTKQMKFITTGIIITLMMVAGSGVFVVSQVKKANLQPDPMAGALAVKKQLQDQDCVLFNHQIKYNARLQPVIMRKSVRWDDVIYISDTISVSLPPLQKGDSQIKVEYKCKGNTTIYSEYRFRDLMK